MSARTFYSLVIASFRPAREHCLDVDRLISGRTSSAITRRMKMADILNPAALELNRTSPVHLVYIGRTRTEAAGQIASNNLRSSHKSQDNNERHSRDSGTGYPYNLQLLRQADRHEG